MSIRWIFKKTSDSGRDWISQVRLIQVYYYRDGVLENYETGLDVSEYVVQASFVLNDGREVAPPGYMGIGYDGDTGDDLSSTLEETLDLISDEAQYLVESKTGREIPVKRTHIMDYSRIGDIERIEGR